MLLKRIDKIYNYIISTSKCFKISDLKEKGGFQSSEISKELGILRNNVSMELNELLRQDKIIKIKTRPVLYIDRVCIERLTRKKLEKGPIEIKDINEILSGEDNKKDTEDESPLDKLIGAKSSLHNQVEQAKAAILYPPNGLHTLIVGQTGVGKTLFANMMYKHAVYIKKLNKDAPFVVFNCADYYNNPQLLISHLFGHIKGAYTGADTDKAGIVEKADGGIMFLDEIHRLPPEGQEMLFYFMDTGRFNRLGETERRRKSCVLIIGATTEDPNSSLLKTFIRRIPIIVTIPSFEKRTLKEKIELIKFLFSNEARRVNKVIKVQEEAVKAIIGSTSYGNIGQMKSNIQLLCARGFLNSINENKCIDIDLKCLPADIKKGIFYLSGKRKEMQQLSNYLNGPIIVNPDGNDALIEEDSYELPFNLYKIIEDKANVLKNAGADDEYINNFIMTDINIHVKSFYNKVSGSEEDRNKILKIVDEDVLLFSEEIKNRIEKKTGKKLSERFLYALSLHLSSFLNRVDNEKNLKHAEIENIIKDKKEEFSIAIEIKGMIELKYNIVVPKIEVLYLTLLISSVNDEQNKGHVAIIVAAHGSSTASSMVDTAKQLLGEGVIEAIDMPLEMNPQETLKDIIEKAKQIDMGRGLLLLVDMGSLVNFDTIITEKTGIKVKTIDMVTTSIVLEAIRKANIFDMDLESIYASLKYFKGYNNFEQVNTKVQSEKEKCIITICSTGKGTAVKLKQLVSNIVSNVTDEKINIVPISISNMENRIEKIKDKYNIIAAVGVKNPKIQAAFIPIEEFIAGNGEEILINIIEDKNAPIKKKYGNIVAKDLCEESLNQFLTYLNPSKIINVLYDFVCELEKSLNTKFNNSQRIRLMIHLGCALERMIVKDGLVYKDDREKLDRDKIKVIEDLNYIFKNSINIELTEDEICYISQMV